MAIMRAELFGPLLRRGMCLLRTSMFPYDWRCLCATQSALFQVAARTFHATKCGLQNAAHEFRDVKRAFRVLVRVFQGMK